MDRDVLVNALDYMMKVVDYYMQWVNDIFQSIEGTPMPGQHARHRLIAVNHSAHLCTLFVQSRLERHPQQETVCYEHNETKSAAFVHS